MDAMHDELWDSELADLIRHAIKKKRKYAGFWSWLERDVAEHGVAQEWLNSISNRGCASSWRLRSRGTGHDPPDCEAESESGVRIGIEVTELVDQQHAGGAATNWAKWDAAKLRGHISQRLARKDDPSRVKDGPYARYIVVLFTDEPLLSANRLRKLLDGAEFGPFKLIDAAWVLSFYVPGEGYRSVRLVFSRNG